MLEAYLTEDYYFPEILHYCNILYETLIQITAGVYSLHNDKDARKLAGITMIAAGYAGDMSEDLCNDLLDDIDFHFNKAGAARLNRCSLNYTRWLRKRLRGLLQMCSKKNASYALTVNTCKDIFSQKRTTAICLQSGSKCLVTQLLKL